MNQRSEKTGRKLAAIMFTDLVGYTALTQADEAHALEVLERHNKLLRPFFPRFNGRVVKTVGDSFLVEFDSTLDAVTCAFEIQKFLYEHNMSVEDDWKIKLRIGIHLGDVVHDDGDIFGDAVNIASRIEPLADPGGICVSEQVFDQIQNKIPQRLEKLEQKELKNVRFPTDVYKVVLPWEKTAGSPRKFVATQSKSSKPRLAILPFVNMSPDPADEYFADGLTEELISKMSLVKNLGVIARTSVMRFKNKEKGVSEIGVELGVNYLVEGSVRKAGNKIRVTAQLIETDTEEHLWAASYDKNFDDIFQVQTDIAAKISDSLPGNIVSRARLEAGDGETENVQAYSLYLKGRQLMNERRKDSLLRALDLFDKATKIDPSFARAYVERGNCYAYLGMRSQISFEEGLGGMKAGARKALEIDENLAEAHALLSFIAWVEDDHKASGMEAVRAIELNPNLPDAYVRLGYAQATHGDLEESIKTFETAQQLDPLSSEVLNILGFGYLWSGREKEALDLWDKNRSVSPYVISRAMVEYYLEKKYLQKAQEEIEELEAMSEEDDYSCTVCRGELAALQSDRTEAEKIIRKLETSFQGRAVNNRHIGIIKYYLGDTDAFFTAMFRACDDHVLDPFLLRYSPLLEGARKDPRYREVLIKNGIDTKLDFGSH